MQGNCSLSAGYSPAAAGAPESEARCEGGEEKEFRSTGGISAAGWVNGAINPTLLRSYLVCCLAAWGAIESFFGAGQLERQMDSQQLVHLIKMEGSTNQERLYHSR
eukprot:1139858-Pelagomonas_calceolata.AAC.11